MPLIQGDEFIVLLDYLEPGFYHHPLLPEELLRFREAGIRTIYRNLSWREAEPAPGKCDWSGVQEWLYHVQSAGMKALIGVGDNVPQWLPPDWFVRGPAGEATNSFVYPFSSVLSPWNAEAQAAQDAHLTLCRDTLNSESVLCIRGLPCSGEMLLHPEPCYFDQHALESFVLAYGGRPQPLGVQNPPHDSQTAQWLRATLLEQAVRQQRILVQNPHQELWSSLHMCFQDTPASGNPWAPDLYQRYLDELKPDSFWGFMFAYFWVSDLVKWRQFDLAGRFGQKLLIGPERCEGLIRNTEAGIKSGARGFILGPLCVDRGYPVQRMADWHYEAVKDSLAKWRAARGE